MKPSYFLGLARHLIETAGHPDIATVESFAEAGAVGHHWPPHGIKVTFTDGTAVFLNTSRTSSPQGDDPNQADQFNPEDLHVPSL